jgi:phosphohistidine phosphatase
MENTKTIYLMRHGKSSWDGFELPDLERPLLPVGINKTLKVAEFLNEKQIQPDILLSSNAIRAYETAKIVANKINHNVEDIVCSEEIYKAGEQEIFDKLYELDNSVYSVMIFGHNPTFTDFVNKFATPMIENLPTSALAAITFNTDKWEDISKSEFTFDFLITPKML